MTKIDLLVASLERKWGVDRLPLLVSPETAERFERAGQMQRAEVEAGCSNDRRAALDAMMGRAWAALDAEAELLGAQPLPAACFEAEWAPGRIFAIASDDKHRQALVLRNNAEGRDVAIFTIAEVAQLIASIPDVARIHELFPGAYLTAEPATWARGGKRKAGPGDDLRDILPLSEEAEA